MAIRVRKSRKSESLKDLRQQIIDDDLDAQDADSEDSGDYYQDAVGWKKNWKPSNVEIDLVEDLENGTKKILAHNKLSGLFTTVLFNENSWAVS